MYRYFVSYDFKHGTGSFVIEIHKIIDSIEDLRTLEKKISIERYNGEEVCINNYILMKVIEE